MERIKKLIFSETFKYLFFGGLATIVYAAFKTLSWMVFKSGWLSETIAQSASIIFAFITNKRWVFQHQSENVWKDSLTFVAGRLTLLLFSILVNFWFIDFHPELLMNFFHITKNVLVAGVNLFLQVFIIVINYIYSKFIVFKKN